MLGFVLFMGLEFLLVMAGCVYLHYRTFRLVPREVFAILKARHEYLHAVDMPVAGSARPPSTGPVIR